MIPAALCRIEDSEAVSAQGLAQGDLRQQFFDAEAESILADLFHLRAESDEAIRSGRVTGVDSTFLAGYPLGCCKPIRDHGLGRLLEPAADDGERPAFRAVGGFRAAGGIVKGVWGVQKGIYFQNAIQIGDLWCDLANDTVDVKRPAVELCPLAEARFEELSSFEQFAQVAACYWGQEAYPNYLFPELAAVLPVILVSPAGTMRLASPKTLLPRNIRLDYALAASFLGGGDQAGRRLPEAVLDRLDRACHAGTGWFAAVPAWCRRFDPTLGPSDAASLVAGERRAVAGLGEREFMHRFFDMIRCASVALH